MTGMIERPAWVMYEQIRKLQDPWLKERYIEQYNFLFSRSFKKDYARFKENFEGLRKVIEIRRFDVCQDKDHKKPCFKCERKQFMVRLKRSFIGAY